MDYAQETQSGLRERPWADGPVVRREKRLVSNGKPSAGVRYVYFQIGDRWRFNRPAPGDRYELVVTTASPCRLRCEFDGFDSAAPVEGAYTSATIAGSDGRTPRTRHIFHLNGARFANRQNGGSDFRLLVAGETVAIEKVVVAPRKPRRPDIVVIMADDMGWSDIGCYGSEIKTPNLDALAKAGLRYTQFYNTSRCCPTRATLLTGLYAHQAGIGHMMSDRGHDGYRGDLNAHCVTIAEVLKPAGYGTYMSGKWHVTPHVSPDGPKHNWPRQRGFDRFFGTIHGAGSFYDPNSLTRDNTQITPDDGFYYTDAISTEAVKSIEQHAAKRADDPLFLYVTYTAPHWPLHALPEDIARYDGVYDDGWDTIRQRRWARQKKLGLIDPRWPLTDRDRGVPAWSDTKDKPWHVRRMEVYAAMVDRMDQGIGRIVDALRKSGRLNDTLILFLADNGGCAEEYGSRGPVKPDPKRPAPLRPMGKDELQRAMQPRVTRDGRTVRTGHGVMPGPADTYIAYGKGWANASNTPFRMYKHWVHEGGIAAPLIAHWPRRVHRSGQLEAQPTHLIDLMATCVDLANATYPKRRGDAEVRPMEGLSLVPTFVGDRLNNRALFWEHEGNRAVRQGRWKLVARGARGPWELYDLEANRTETTDLAKTNAERTQSMAALWHRWAERCHVLPVNPQRRESRPSFSTQRRFDLGPTADLPRNRAPYVKDRGFTITVDITKPGRSGVLVAQGGSSHGWSLHLEDGRPVFSTRHGGRLTEIKSKQPLTSNRIQVRLRRSGKITITAGDQQVARGDAGRGLVAMPADGLQVARDLKGPVGRYQTAHPFDGTVAKVVIELDMEK
ncbi:MAG: arylsulfatase [Planctomycetes bacterium]|nr:arylsulfatase [Planctomycetota bacterium]